MATEEPAMTTESLHEDDVDARELLHFLTQETRFHLVVNIIQHPEGLPSLYELEQCNPGLSESTVYKHLHKLVDAGVVETVELPQEERTQGLPWKFYGLTDEGRAFLEEHTLLQAEGTLHDVYDSIADKPEKMRRYEAAPRPER